MSTREEIMHLEERLRQAELGPDPSFFQEYLADDAVLDGHQLKTRVVEAHRPGSGEGQKFTTVEMRYDTFVEHGNAVVLTCVGHYEGPQFKGTLKFMRVWLKQDGRWRIIAGATLK
jgi:Domain of unknown function (DUF4440)